MHLKTELERFVEVFGREDYDIGKVTLSGEDAETDSLDSLYKILNFEKPLVTVGELFLTIEPQFNLEKAQLGWYKIKHEESWVSDDKLWNKDWIVFGDRNGDAIFYDKSDGKVYGSIDKRQKYLLGSSLTHFFSVLTQGLVAEKEKFNFETSDDTEEPLPEFLDHIYTILRQTDKEAADSFMEFFFE